MSTACRIVYVSPHTYLVDILGFLLIRLQDLQELLICLLIPTKTVFNLVHECDGMVELDHGRWSTTLWTLLPLRLELFSLTG